MNTSPLNILFIVSSLLSIVNCDIRCHCNQPACLRTGYMCKSTGPQAACFVEHSGFHNVDRASDISRHGCIEMLPIEERTPCLDQALANFASQNGGQAIIRSSNSHYRHHQHGSDGDHNQHRRTHHQTNKNVRTLNKSIMCCLDDMCNYVKAIMEDSSNSVDTRRDATAQNSGHHVNNNKNVEDIDSLGEHLQESYGISDTFSRTRSLWTDSLVIFGIIVFILFAIILFFVFLVRLIRQGDTSRTTTKLSEAMSPKMNANIPKSFNSYWRTKHPTRVYASNQIQSKHPISLNMKMDVEHIDGGTTILSDFFTRLDEDIDINCSIDTDTNLDNLPNIISGHSFPQVEKMLEEQEIYSGAVHTNAYRLGRERKNSIYLTLLPQPPSQH